MVSDPNDRPPDGRDTRVDADELGDGLEGEGSERGERNEHDERERERRGWLGGYARRFIKAGADAFMDRDELLRRFVPELPREVAAYLFKAGEDVRDDVLRIFSRELRRFLDSLNLTEELQKILTSTSFEIKTEIRFIPNDQSVLKSLRKTKVRVKRRGKDGKEEVVEESEEETTEGEPGAGG
jgi:hypothetical protein